MQTIPIKPNARTWMPTTAGILEIVAGSLTAVVSICIALGAAVIGSGAAWLGLNQSDFGGMALSFVAAIMLIVALVVAVVAALEVVGGISAIQRKRWGLALAGAIATAITGNLIGIFSIVLLALSKEEFVQ